MMRPTLARVALVALAVVTTACTPEILGRVNAIDITTVLASGDLGAMVAEGRRVGQVLAGCATVLLCFHCWYRATIGSPWLAVAKEYLFGTILCVYVLTTVNTPVGLDQWIYRAGQGLGELFAPKAGYLLFAHDQAVSQNVKFLLELQGSAPEAPSLARQFLQSVAFVAIQPVAVLGIVVNAIAIHVVKLVLQASYVFLVAFYWALTPLVAPTVILPQTRYVFRGWVQSYVSVSLWPLFMAIVERLAAAIPWADWMGIDGLGVGDYFGAVTHWAQGQFMLLVLNVVFLLVYVAIPVVSAKLVSGAVRAGVA